jgi:hypothetical protein
MSGKKKVVLIHPDSDRHSGAQQTGMPELAHALRRAGAEVAECFMTDDLAILLDALAADALPVVVKG